MEEGMLYKRLNGKSQAKVCLVICLVLGFSGSVFSADVILNEYNAVAGNAYLGGGDAFYDLGSGGSRRASDSYFGRIAGNGGDWFELVVITDHLDMRNWMLDVYNDGSLSVTLDLTDDIIWSDLSSGTIITVSENLPSDISYDPEGGDWWIHVQAGNLGDGLYIEASNFPVSKDDWQLRIRNSIGAVMFGPAGEGVYPPSGVSDIEIFRLEAAPSASITADSIEYDDGKNFSTFGSPNQWGLQNFSGLRTVVEDPSGLTLFTPNGAETIMGGTTYEITWGSIGNIYDVDIDFSIDNGLTWSEVYPANIGNTGSYDWLVPNVDSQLCDMRITKATNVSVYDTNNFFFTVYQCPLEGDVTDDCIVDLFDLSVMAFDWLGCGNPHNPACL